MDSTLSSKGNRKTTDEERQYLLSRGWIEDSAFSEQMTPWRWRQPGTRAKFRLQDALDNQQALDKLPKGKK